MGPSSCVHLLMRVPVVEFFPGSLADIDNFDIESEVDPGEGVIGIDDDSVSFDFLDFGDACPVWGLCLEAHAGLEVGIFGELAAFCLGNEFRVVFSVAIGGGNFGSQFLALFLSFELLFESGYDISMTVQVGEGVPSLA